MAAADLAQIADVDIDPDGVFKYVLIRVHAAPPSEAPAGKSKEIVRGYKWAEYHADIYDKVSGEMQKKGYSCECLGGGRISHQSQDKKIHVYGYSMAAPWAGGPTRKDCSPWRPAYPGRSGRAGHIRLQRAPSIAASWVLLPMDAQSQDGAVSVGFCLQGYGRAQHSVSTEKIKAVYPDYEVTWADDGY